jgi:type IV fimbrial biogenesis protein FimT
MTIRPLRQRGVTLIEMMIAIAILGILLALGMPSYRAWIQNSQIRTAAESILAGLQLARNQAVHRNAAVRFQFTDSVDAGCGLSTTVPNWVVSMDDPTGSCNAAPSDTVAPRIIQTRATAEGSRNVVIAATASAISFNGLGRLVGGNTLTVNIDVPDTILANADSRDLRVIVTGGGQIRMCDPAVGDLADPRHC